MPRKAIAATLAATLILFTANQTASAATQPSSAALRRLNIAIGKWAYHGKNVQTPLTKAGNWTWDVDCRWTANGLFLVCSFTMNWPEGTDHSVSISTYNDLDKSYWHYEVIDDYHGNKPVISRMTVVGSTWTDSTDQVSANGAAASHYRVVYHYMSSTAVEVTFLTSKDGSRWTTLGHGEGIKISH